MDRNELKRHTCIIIRKNGEYLIGRSLLTSELRWNNSDYEAWRTRNRDDAWRVAEYVGGVTVLFNPITGEIREMGT